MTLDYIMWRIIRRYRKHLIKRKSKMLTDPSVILGLIDTEKAAMTAAFGRAPTVTPPVDLQPIADGIQANIDLANAAFGGIVQATPPAAPAPVAPPAA